MLRFFRQIDRDVPRDLDIHVVLDNLSAHKAPEVTEWLAKPALPVSVWLARADYSLSIADHGRRISPNRFRTRWLAAALRPRPILGERYALSPANAESPSKKNDYGPRRFASPHVPMALEAAGWLTAPTPAGRRTRWPHLGCVRSLPMCPTTLKPEEPQKIRGVVAAKLIAQWLRRRQQQRPQQLDRLCTRDNRRLTTHQKRALPVLKWVVGRGRARRRG